MKQFRSKYAKFIVSPLIERVTITNKTFDRQKKMRKKVLMKVTQNT